MDKYRTVALDGNSLKTKGETKNMRHIDSVIEANQAAGGSFFEKRTVLYFKNKVLPTMYGGKYFISYDLTENEGKRFTVRKVLNSGLIAVAGTRHAYASKAQALAAIKDLLGMPVLS